MNELERRISELERTHGPGEFGEMVTEIVYSTPVTEAGFECLDERWQRTRGETDSALRKRALQDLLNNDRRTLIIKLCQNVAKAMEKKEHGCVKTN